MNIDDLTIAQARQIAAMFPRLTESSRIHPLEGKRVVWIGTHGFIWVGTLTTQDGVQCLTNADNIRYWSQRDSGLPELARNGYRESDRIDAVGTVYPATCVALYPCGDWDSGRK